ncbi:uncharacterized protein LOC134824951 [Bolinopsis microptera]|uniref:uncharacterized protein LOC134824951 n=1 Tax=Bolinopsis microptera TaxID=2820187 RepID=UPI00307A0FA5
MIDLVTPKSLKKSGKKKSTSIEFGISSENVLKPDVKRKRQNESLSEDLNEPESTTPDENFMLPGDIKFIKSDKALEVDESTIPSDLDDPNNSLPLSNLIACRSSQAAPESGLKCVWSHKRKVLKKNSKTCRCYSELEQQTLARLNSIKVLKSKKRFVEHFTEFEKQASDVQCEYPYCKRLDPVPASQRTVSCKLVKKSKRHKLCKKTRTSQLLVGSKRVRGEGLRKVRLSSYFINEVVRLMLDNPTVWCLDTLNRLLKTKQLNSSITRDVARVFLDRQDVLGLQSLVRNTRTCSEKHVAEVIHSVLMSPVFSPTNKVDGKDKHTLDQMLGVLLSLPFESSAMKRNIKLFITPQQAKVLLTFIYEQLLNSRPVHSARPTFDQVVHWCDSIVEVYFSTLVTETELVRKINNSINQHIHSCRSMFALNEFLFRIKHSKKFSH